ncbi:Na+/H+ antiporter subunit C [Niveibacterium sp. 24ML]|uniref:Na+/H+ antiporter subunit C n=1 Tax=Niveibacterium sp. 24ML TaxID=2985512 RepID=UPI00226F28C3|nr:Na+/H+ antiporter subunit C [Niveibacterium sp. 24ML]MCX9157979.1 Na+/H+ antiporter subunit C [Niveibacterium sp. 24ML]
MTLELMLASQIAILVACALYCLMRGRLFDVIVGITLLSYGVNLFLFAMGRPAPDKAPIVPAHGGALSPADYVDPLPQALVLTAIVIGFAMTGLMVALALRRKQADGDDAGAEQ